MAVIEAVEANLPRAQSRISLQFLQFVLLWLGSQVRAHH